MILKIYIIGAIISFLHSLYTIKRDKEKWLKKIAEHDLGHFALGVTLFIKTAFWFISEPIEICMKLIEWIIKKKIKMGKHKITKTRKVEIKEYFCNTCKDWGGELDVITCESCEKKICNYSKEADIKQPYNDVWLCSKCAKETFEDEGYKKEAK